MRFPYLFGTLEAVSPQPAVFRGPDCGRRSGSEIGIDGDLADGSVPADRPPRPLIQPRRCRKSRAASAETERPSPTKLSANVPVRRAGRRIGAGKRDAEPPDADCEDEEGRRHEHHVKRAVLLFTCDRQARGHQYLNEREAGILGSLPLTAERMPSERSGSGGSRFGSNDDHPFLHGRSHK